MLLTPRFFWGRAPKFLDLDYKTQTVSGHVAKFEGDRLRDLGERVAKEKNTSSILEDLPLLPYGRPNNPPENFMVEVGYTGHIRDYTSARRILMTMMMPLLTLMVHGI